MAGVEPALLPAPAAAAPRLAFLAAVFALGDPMPRYDGGGGSAEAGGPS